MKNFLCFIILAGLILTSCEKNATETSPTEPETNSASPDLYTITPPETTAVPETTEQIESTPESQSGLIVYHDDNGITLHSPIVLSEIDKDKLEQCTSLRVQVEEETDLSFISSLTNLESLSLEEGFPLAYGYELGEVYITSYEFLNKLENLKKFALVSGNNDFDISFLSGLDLLEIVVFSGLNIVNTDKAVFENVIDLSLEVSNYLFEDIVKTFPNVETLFLSVDVYVDFDEILDWKELREIQLMYARYSGLSALASFPNLEKLDIVFAKPIEGYDVDYSCLLELTSLKELRIPFNILTDEQVEEFERLNPECELVLYSGL